MRDSRVKLLTVAAERNRLMEDYVKRGPAGPITNIAP
jgi:hypothetical protein